MKLNMKFTCTIYIACALGHLVKYIWLTNKTKGDKPNPREATSVATRMGALPFLNSKKDTKNLSVLHTQNK